MVRLQRRPDKPGGTYYADFFENGRRVRRSLKATVLKEAKKRQMVVLAGKVEFSRGTDRDDPRPDQFWEAYADRAKLYKSPLSV